jgi:hypothetical protein
MRVRSLAHTSFASPWAFGFSHFTTLVGRLIQLNIQSKRAFVLGFQPPNRYRLQSVSSTTKGSPGKGRHLG